MTVYTDNPAGRLHELLSAFRRANGDRSAFMRVLKIPYNDKTTLMRSFGQVFALPDDINIEIDLVNEDNFDPDLALRWRDTLADVMGSTLFWGEKNPDSPTFSDFQASLEYCSFVLHKFRPRQIPSDSDLKRLQDLTAELIGQLKDDPSIDDDLRAFLQVHAEAMERALNDLPVRGVVPLEEAFDRAVGGLNRRPDLTAKSATSPGVWKRFGDLLIAAAAVLQISTSAFVLPGQIRQAIEGPQPTPVEIVQAKPHGNAPSDVGTQRSKTRDNFEEKESASDGTSSAPAHTGS